MTYHYLYKTTHVPSGKYYHGSHSFHTLDNDYLGSGRWVTSIIDRSNLEKEILQIFETFEELVQAETNIIRENWDDPLQMNWNDSGVGWSSINNPSKINHPFKGRKHTEESKRKSSETKKAQYASGEVIPYMKGKKQTEEQKEKQSKTMKENFATGKCKSWNKGQIGLCGGWTQSELQKTRAREANQKTWLVTFPDGHQEVITNLRQFALSNGLDQGNLMHVVSGRQKQSKGYKVKPYNGEEIQLDMFL